MKLFISADIEGIAAVVHGEHTIRDGKEHERARRLMTAEVNAAIEGALAAGAKEILVNDSHGTMRNLLPEELHPEATLLTGSPKPLSMMEGIDASFQGAFFVGYHARMGERGILSHTYDSRVVSNLRLNGVPVGETGLNAVVAGTFGVPVLLVTGDSQVVAEAKALLGDIEGVAVKNAVTRYAAKSLHPLKAQALIREGAGRAVAQAQDRKPFRLTEPLVVEIEFVQAGMADQAEMIPGAVRLNGRTVTSTGSDPLVGFKAFRAMIALAATVA